MSAREVHAILAGPVKNPNANRTVKHGALHVEGTSLRLRTTDDLHVRLTFDGAGPMISIAKGLLEASGEFDEDDLSTVFRMLNRMRRPTGKPT